MNPEQHPSEHTQDNPGGGPKSSSLGSSEGDRTKLFSHSLFHSADRKPPRVFITDAEDGKVCEIRRHPFGIIVLYIQATIGAVGSLLLLFFIAPSALPDSSTSKVYGVLTALSIVVLVLMALLLFVATLIYRESRLVVTSDNITQVIQRGLFSTKTSRLSMASVEDVTAEQRGFFATILDYGTLKVETAGEQENFTFPYCPNPRHYAGEILAARQQFVDQDAERSYDIRHHSQARS